MKAVLAAFTECAHSIATPEPIQRPQSAPGLLFSFLGERDAVSAPWLGLIISQ